MKLDEIDRAKTMVRFYRDQMPGEVYLACAKLFNKMYDYRSALEFYANTEHWRGGTHGIVGSEFSPPASSGSFVPDCGRRARKALEE